MSDFDKGVLGPQLAAHLGKNVHCYGLNYQLIQFDFELDRLWVRILEGSPSDRPELLDLHSALQAGVLFLRSGQPFNHCLDTEIGRALAAAIGSYAEVDGCTREIVQVDFDSDTIWLGDPNDDYEPPEPYYLSGLLVDDDFVSSLGEHSPSPYDHGLQNPNPTKETQPMKTTVIQDCKAAALSAAEYQAGKALNLAAIKAIKPHTPLMVRGYLDSPFASPVLAVALAVLADQLPDSSPLAAKARKASRLMLSAAFMDGADKLIDVEKILNGLLDKLPSEAKPLLDI